MCVCVNVCIYLSIYIWCSVGQPPGHYITFHYITLHYTTLHYITFHFITLHYITLHTYRHPSIHPSIHPSTHPSIHPSIQTHTHAHIQTYIHTYITLHYITLHYTTLHYITLHYIQTSIHPSTHPPIHPSIHPNTHTHIHTYRHIYIHTLHYITSHHITLHCIALHCITLHYITLHIYIHTTTTGASYPPIPWGVGTRDTGPYIRFKWGELINSRGAAPKSYLPLCFQPMKTSSANICSGLDDIYFRRFLGHGGFPLVIGIVMTFFCNGNSFWIWGYPHDLTETSMTIQWSNPGGSSHLLSRF